MELNWINDVILKLTGLLVGPATRFWPVYLIVSLLICIAVIAARPMYRTKLRRRLPTSICKQASYLSDLKFLIQRRGITAPKWIIAILFCAVLTHGVAGLFGARSETSLHNPVAIAALLLLIHDFGTYWLHRARRHLVPWATSTLMRSVYIGTLQGVAIGLLIRDVPLLALIGVNAGYAALCMAGTGLRHSHVWLGFGRVLEHILISPAQHQIHHSSAAEHRNKNYGEVLAIWDWMFGTLYVSRKRHDSWVAAKMVSIHDHSTRITMQIVQVIDTMFASAQLPTDRTIHAK
ncbi:sterol desaturase family protein [Roseovarius pelagicus]|uniref:Sterol desaturase family protein n=1 Tax=Roseovarius pelagicus TaxID=2980108 RepID=A0ABY6DBB6_9RHOB|nr:sterol desaturase family protein [Roseovarius pelagicus]UXX83441.1 sterol desaturase family protein [Roseovarius pelagicus]